MFFRGLKYCCSVIVMYMLAGQNSSLLLFLCEMEWTFYSLKLFPNMHLKYILLL